MISCFGGLKMEITWFEFWAEKVTLAAVLWMERMCCVHMYVNGNCWRSWLRQTEDLQNSVLKRTVSNWFICRSAKGPKAAGTWGGVSRKSPGAAQGAVDQFLQGCTYCNPSGFDEIHTNSNKYASWCLLLVTTQKKRRLHSNGQGFTNRETQNSCLSSSMHAEIAVVLSHCPHEAKPEFRQFFWAWIPLYGCFRLASCFLRCLSLRSVVCQFLHWQNCDHKNNSVRANTHPGYHP